MSIILAIEAAIAGGSISLLYGSVEIDSWVGSSDVSKAEELLANIKALLDGKGLARRDIGSIAVSAGPGSFTGIRIGLATAMGLKNGLGVRMLTVSALDAIAAKFPGENLVAAVPMGRNTVCLQHFMNGDGNSPLTVDQGRFDEIACQDSRTKYVLHEQIYSRRSQPAHVSNFGSNVAKAIGLFAIDNPRTQTEPLFISKKAL